MQWSTGCLRRLGTHWFVGLPLTASSHLSFHPPFLLKSFGLTGFEQAAATPGFYASENVMRSWQLCFALFSSKEKDWEGIRVNPSLGHPHPHPQHPHRLWPFSGARSCS